MGRKRSSNKARNHNESGGPTSRRDKKLLHCKCHVDRLENEFEPTIDENQVMTLNSLVILKMQEEDNMNGKARNNVKFGGLASRHNQKLQHCKHHVHQLEEIIQTNYKWKSRS